MLNSLNQMLIRFYLSAQIDTLLYYIALKYFRNVNFFLCRWLNGYLIGGFLNEKFH